MGASESGVARPHLRKERSMNARRFRLSMVLACAALGVAVLASTAVAATCNFGNAATARENLDMYPLTVFDNAATAPSDGVITGLHYFAQNTGSFQFVLIDSITNPNVRWM